MIFTFSHFVFHHFNNSITEIHDFINKQTTKIDEYDEKIVNRLIQKITVFDDYLVVEFKSGVSVEIEG